MLLWSSSLQLCSALLKGIFYEWSLIKCIFRFESFAPPREGNAKWFVDGCDYLAAVANAIVKVIWALIFIFLYSSINHQTTDWANYMNSENRQSVPFLLPWILVWYCSLILHKCVYKLSFKSKVSSIFVGGSFPNNIKCGHLRPRTGRGFST